ncbi:pilus assembly protein [Hydrogenophaga sp. A37]|uniref:pilus assembly protein n=1 Tax=Hydrogenophaga sp. A37 TaxID=1945864 RepID=UPI0009862D6C|nr:PilC/PilY family type IV pilus protein [Hydrogenophaga sp. A37]OOG79557.1 hypothetical protein B0E41_23295 [Hydrogenophaga sp. A37]
MEQSRHFPFRFGRRIKALLWTSLSVLSLLSPGTSRAVDLADQPLFATVNVPGNLILALSVEWPTATTPAYDSTTAYSDSSTYLGYFDPDKCYVYVPVSTGKKESPDYSNSYFSPSSEASKHTCSSKWSGNYLNWAAMQTLDAFRWVMTGGYRSTDTKDTTILTKTYAANNAKTWIPNKKIEGSSSVSGATPLAWDAATTRLRTLGTAMYITKGGDVDTTTAPVDYTNQEKPSDTTVYRVYINVKVCDAGAGLESNCTSYPSKHAKPEGLMQKYASKLRYSAFGYYNHNGSEKFQRDGGVMRAGMKFIGPEATAPGKPATTNSATEWDAQTGVMLTNPDSADATQTEADAKGAGYTVSIPNSGVMNYLNKFGYSAKSYKNADPVSELYYAALRYFKKQGNLDQYTNLSGAGSKETASAWLDGFPAVTHWNDPIAYTCQKNFVLGIGDINSHRDANLPGSTLRSKSTLDNINPAVTDDSVDVAVATNMVGQLEGLSKLGDKFADIGESSCLTELNDNSKWNRCNSYYLAGLAYDAHTKDIRPDLIGSQTVNSYFMDVLEEQKYQHRNQYWLAAKYGGFTVPFGFSPYASSNGTGTIADEAWYTSSDMMNAAKKQKRPDNYFPGNRPDVMQSGLTAAFAKIVSETDSATGTALSTVSPNVASAGTASFAASYDPTNWTGALVAYELTFDSKGDPTSTEKWNARTLLSASTTTSATRKIVTCCKKSDGAALPFKYDAMKDASLISRTYLASFANVPGVSTEAQSIKSYIEYLRGDTDQEIANGGAYRTRQYRLGDIVSSKPIAVGKPDFPYFDVYNPGYSAFKTTHAKRSTVVYVGANDGMLHAFDGSIGQTGSGKELFAYVPSFVYGDKDTAATSGLAALGSPSYAHRYYVDATAAHFDLDFSKTDGAADATKRDWRTVLIGGLGKGGKGYFAIDVTDSSTWTDESKVAGKVLWEFTDKRMGYSYGRPSVVKTAKYGWVVLFTSGYNNSDGKGYFFIVNPRNGELIEAVEAGGTADHPLNIGEHTAYVSSYTDMTADAVYAGDLAGNVWRLDLTGKTGTTYDKPVQIATLANAADVAQPVSTRPLIEVEPNSGRRYVLLGTGKLLADSDLANGDAQSFYAIIDGTGKHGDFYTGATLPSGVSFPVTRSKLEENKDLLNGIGSAPTSSMGWYFDLPVTNGIAQRVNVNPTANQGVVAFVANRPNGDACSPGGVGAVYATVFADGKSVLTGKDGKAVAWLSPTNGTLTDIAIQRVDDRLQITVGGNDANGKPTVMRAPAKLTTASGLKQMNWRGMTSSK